MYVLTYVNILGILLRCKWAEDLVKCRNSASSLSYAQYVYTSAVWDVSVVVCCTYALADSSLDDVPDAPRHRGEQQRPSSARLTPRTKVCGVCVC